METIYENATPPAAIPPQIPAEFQPQMLQIPGLGMVAPRGQSIASVHFETRTHRFHHSGRRTFVLPAAPKGKYTTLKFYDSQMAVKNTSDPQDASPGFLPMPVPLESIAKDLIDHWAQRGVGAMAKFPAGIMLIAGDTPIPGELMQMKGMQEKLCRAGVEEADRFERSGKGEITEFHRNCLDWLGSEKRNWFRPIEQGDTKVSVATGNRINMTALSDGAIDLLEYYVKYDLDPAMYGDTHVVALFKSQPKMREKIAARMGATK